MYLLHLAQLQDLSDRKDFLDGNHKITLYVMF